MSHSDAVTLDPIFVSVKQAAQILGISPRSAWTLVKSDPPQLEARWHGSRCLVLVTSLREYAAQLPSERPAKESA